MESKLQDLAPGEIVTLYELDNTVNGGRRLRYTPAVDAAAAPSRAVQFGGHTYLPLPVEMRGFKRAVDGPVARPELRISAVNAETTALLLGADNLRGARVTRFRTLAQFLASFLWYNLYPVRVLSWSWCEVDFCTGWRFAGDLWSLLP